MRIGAIIRATDIRPGTIHRRGLPPGLGRETVQSPMAWPACVVIGPQPGGIFLIRYSSDGEEVGDTWHQSTDEAREQASEEFDGLISDWHHVPPDVPDSKILDYLKQVCP